MAGSKLLYPWLTTNCQRHAGANSKVNPSTPSTMMAIRALSLFVYFLTYLPRHALSAATSSPLPLIIWHGLGDDYAADGLVAVGDLARQIHPGTFVYNIRLDSDPSVDRRDTFFGNLTTQLAQVCADVANHPVLGQVEYVDALGFSQGGQFLRGLVERCTGEEFEEFAEELGEAEGMVEMNTRGGKVPQIRSLVTFGAQHNGIAEFSDCESTDWICRSARSLLRANTWSDFIQRTVVPAQYFRNLDESTGLPSDDYLEHSNFLADVNNEREEKNEKYKDNIARLANLVMFVFEDDETVIPKESGWFAEVNRTSGDVTPLRERPIYKEDWIGLRKLDERGGLFLEKTPGRHMNLTDDGLEKVFKEYFGPLRGGDRTVMSSGEDFFDALEL